MRMNGMSVEDVESKVELEKLVAIGKLKDEADFVVEGDADHPELPYAVTKKPEGFEFETVVNPYEFAQKVNRFKVLVIHGDGSFDRYNHTF